MQPYFRLMDDLGVPSRWHLGRVCDDRGIVLDSRDFQRGDPVAVDGSVTAKCYNSAQRIRADLPLHIVPGGVQLGKPLDLTFSTSDLPIATSEVADVFERVSAASIQRIPIVIEGESRPYDVLNVSRRIGCLDMSRSEVEWWMDADRDRPDKAGKPRMITRLIIDRRRTEGLDVFRVLDWETALIVSSTVKSALEAEGYSGFKFLQV